MQLSFARRAGVLITGLTMVLSLLAAVALTGDSVTAATPPYCRNMPATIYEGQFGSDFDVGTGTWTFTGTAGDDVIVGSSTTDVVNAGNGNDTVCGGNGNDILHGDGGTDFLSGGGGVDEHYGDSGNDTIVFTKGDTVMQGGAGFDYAAASGSLAVTLNVGGSGFERAVGTAAGDTFTSSTVPDGAAGVTLYGGGGNDTLSGSPGRDVLRGDSGDDTISGLAGNDTVIFDSTDTTTAPTGGSGVDAATASGITAVTLDVGGRGFERAVGTAAGDTFTSSTVPDGAAGVVIYGKDGNDTATGSPGPDYLRGEAGNDTVAGGAGNDYVYFDANDLTSSTGGTGTDRAIAIGTAGVTLDVGGRGFERADGTTADDTFTSSSPPDFAQGVTVLGKGGGDLISGSSGPDYLSGDSGGDSLDGMGGNDVVLFDPDDSSVMGGPGLDLADARASRDPIATFDVGLRGFERAYGSNFDDTFTSSLPDGADGVQIVGLAGDDSLSGTIGPDVLRGDGGTDTLVGGDGDDRLTFDASDPSPEGGAGYDRAEAIASASGIVLDLGGHGIELAHGSEFVDTFTNTGATPVRILGRGGNDSITGGDGADIFTGGTGGDHFSGGPDTDSVTDFNAAEGDTRDNTLELPDLAPTVTGRTPANGATGIATDATITVDFSESVNVTTSSFTLECPSGTGKTLVVSGSGSSSITLSPDASLPDGITCTVTVVATQVSDVDSADPPNTMVGNDVFSFTTDAQPTVTGTTPTDNATNQAVGTNVTITFSEDVTPSGEWFSVTCPTSGTRNVGATQVSGGPQTWTINPNTDFALGETCTVIVDKDQVDDIDANDPPAGLSADYIFDFTMPDVAPTVTGTMPADNAVQQATNANVEVTFSEDVVVTGEWFSIVCTASGTRNTTNAAVSGGPKTFTIDPNVDFTEGESCTLNIVAMQVADTDALDPPNTMTANASYSFTVDTPPTVTGKTPAADAINQAVDTNLTVTFNEPVTASGTWFTIVCATGVQRDPSNTAVTVAPTTFTLNPNADLPAGETCTVTIVAAQVDDQDSGDPPANLAANFVWSFGTQPVAVNDSSTATGNIAIALASTGTGTLLDNDVGTSLAVVEVQGAAGNVGSQVDTTAVGRNGVKGKITLLANGSLTYDPPPGYTGSTDTFTYKVGNAAGTSNAATVTIAISDMMWFICNACGGNNRGTLQDPFTSIGTFSAANTGASPAPQEGQKLYIRSGTYDGTDTLTLRNNQLVHGQGIAASSIFLPNANSVSAFAALGATGRPLIQASSGNGINVASGNTVKYLNVGNSATDINGTNFGTLTIDNVTLSGTGTALNLNTGTLAATFDSVTSSSGTNNISLTSVNGTLTMNGGALSGATSRALDVSGGSANITYTGSVSNNGSGISIVNKTGGTVTFTGGMVLSTGGNAAFTATGGGTVVVCANNPCGSATAVVNTLTTSTGTALNVANTTIGSSGLTFRSIAASGAPNGIVLNNTSNANGRLVVTGNGGTCTSAATCTGGAIQSSTGAGILLTSVPGGASFTRIAMTNGGDDGIRASTVGTSNSNTGIVLANSFVSGNGNVVSERGLEYDNVVGYTSISSTTITGSADDNARIDTDNGALDLTVSGSTFSSNSTTAGADGLLLYADGTVTMRVRVENSTFSANRDDGFNLLANADSNVDLTFNSNIVNAAGNAGAASAHAGVTLASNTTSNVKIAMNGGTISGADGSALIINPAGTAAATFDLVVDNVTIGTAGVAGSGSATGQGIRAIPVQNTLAKIVIKNSHINGTGQTGILARHNDGGGTSHFTITGNTIAGVGAGNEAIYVQSASLSTDTTTVCADIGGAGALENTFAGVASGGVTDIAFTRRSSAANAHLTLPGFDGNMANLTSYIQNRNVGSPSVANFSGALEAGPSQCSQPASLPTLPTAPLP